MKKPKFIQSQEELDYKKRLAAFMQEVNPKPTSTEIEKLKEHYLASRGEQSK